MEESLVPMAGIPALFIMQLLQFDAFEAINSAALLTSMWLNKHAEAIGDRSVGDNRCSQVMRFKFH